jgi:hypothetical protein
LARERWKENQASLDPTKLVFVDETGATPRWSGSMDDVEGASGSSARPQSGAKSEAVSAEMAALLSVRVFTCRPLDGRLGLAQSSRFENQSSS